MKKIFINALAALALVTTSCNDEDNFFSDNMQEEGVRTVVLSASLGNGNARSTFELDENSKQATFKWATDDKISVFIGSDNATQTEFTLKPEDNGKTSGSFTGNLSESQTIGTLAYYPYNVGHTAAEFVLPAEYGIKEDGSSTGYAAYVENTHAAFVATIVNKQAVFQNIAGTLCVKFDKVPKGVDKFVLTADKQISGTFTIEEEDSYKVIKNPVTTDANAKTVTHHFEALAEAGAMTFYVPLPVGTYSSLKVELKVGDDLVFTKTHTEEQVITCGKLVMMNDLASADYTVTKGADDKKTYTVYTAEGLLAVNGLVQNDLDANITLAANITLPAPADSEKESNWTPIGTPRWNKDDERYDAASGYTGTFNGNGHSIAGLIINGTDDEVHYGLIYFLGQGGKIENLTLIDCKISSTYDYVGGFAGTNNGTIAYCNIKNSTIQSTNSSTSHSYVGGIAGENYYEGIVTNCFVYAPTTISGTKQMVGAIAGYNLYKITSCEVVNNSKNSDDNISITGSFIVGGIVGNNTEQKSSTPEITSCKVVNSGSGKITILTNGDNAGYNVGGIAGSTSNSTITDCLVDNCDIIAEATGTLHRNAGGITGFNNGSIIKGCIAQNSRVTGQDRVGGIAGKNGSSVKNGAKYKNGIIIACLANNMTVNKQEVDTAGETKGGIVGINVDSEKGFIIACYAYASGEGVVGVNNSASVDTSYDGNGVVTYSSYATSGSTTVTSVAGTGSLLNPTANVDWSAAVTEMNKAIYAWNKNNSYACTYRWAEKVNGTATTYSTAALEQFTPSENDGQ